MAHKIALIELTSNLLHWWSRWWHLLLGSLISYQNFHLLLSWESQHQYIRVSSLATSIFISIGTSALIRLCSHSGKDVLSVTKANSSLWFYPWGLLRGLAPSIISLSPCTLSQLIRTGSLLSIKTYSSPSHFINTFCSIITSTSSASILTTILDGQVFQDPLKSSVYLVSKFFPPIL